MSKPSLYDHIDALVELDEAGQRDYLQTLESKDSELAARLRQMVRAQASTESYLSHLALDIGQSSSAEVDSAWASGRRIGPYRLLSVLGTGGMGSVFLAERADSSFDRQVALKVLPLDLGAPELVARFDNERRLLARLCHPQIAQLLDAGISADSRPYFVMEYVQGLAIDQYADRQRLTLEQRLRLLMQVADAVHYAHQNLIVHRDLKPANILVSDDEQVKLLDFGIAKLLSEHPRAITEPQSRWYTPAYAAPEQRLQEAATTAIDVYGLGLLLHQSLTGQLPATDMVTPALPSAVVATVCDSEVAHARRLSVIQLRRRLRGDLDIIVQTALAPQPQDRYRDVAALYEDLSRHLDGLPIRAQPTPWPRRIRKFLHRYRTQVSVAATVTSLILLFAGYALTQAHQARLERDRAQQISELLVEVFSAADPAQARGRDYSARELLDVGARTLRLEGHQDPAIKASMLIAIGRSYRSLGDYERAIELLEEASQLQRDSASEELASGLFQLGQAQMLNGASADAESNLREALTGAREHAGKDSLLSLKIQGRLGRLYESLGQIDRARSLLSDTLAGVRRAHSDNPAALSVALNDMAAVALTQGNYAEVEPLLRQAIELNRERDRQTSSDPAHPEWTPHTATLINNLGLVVYFQGRLQEAESLYRQALAIRRRILDPKHPDLAQSLTNLGLLLNDLAQPEQAIAALEEALVIRRASLPATHVRVVSGINNLAMALQAGHDYEQARALYVEALDALTQTLGETHPAVATTESNLASVLLDSGDLIAARRHFEHSLTLRRQLHPPDHPYLAYSLVGLGQTLVALGEAGLGLPLLDEALAIRAQLPADHWALAEARYARAYALIKLGQLKEARSLLKQALAALSKRGSNDRHYLRAAGYQQLLELALEQNGASN